MPVKVPICIKGETVMRYLTCHDVGLRLLCWLRCVEAESYLGFRCGKSACVDGKLMTAKTQPLEVHINSQMCGHME